jgi:quercetin dioxygenase-like cupin family protein
MDHREYTKAVEEKNYPTDRMCPLGSKFEDDRGMIQNLIESAGVNAVAIIHSKAGSKRSNHYHLESDHYLYIVSGSLLYYERLPNESSANIAPTFVTAGEIIFTPPGVVHLTEFLSDTVMISIGSNPRSHHHHENDLVREEFFNHLGAE